MNPLILAFASGAVLWYVWKRKMPPAPWTFLRLERSGIADRYGLDNRVPKAFHWRARGLAYVAAQAEQDGARITSAYRSLEVNGAVYAEKLGKSMGLEGDALRDYVQNNTSSRPGGHTSCSALDDGVSSGSDTHAELAAADARWRANPHFSAGIVRTIFEGNHLHVRFSEEWLESYGHRMEGNA